MSKTVVVLGAGASRSASYIGLSDFQSPLDGDFFDLLKKMEATDKGIFEAQTVLEWVRKLGLEYFASLERAFYTLQSRAYLLEKFVGKGKIPPADDEVVKQFAACVQAVLRKAHRTRVCSHRSKLFQTLGRGDAVISFNYDLVAERAFRSRAEASKVEFEDLYGFTRHSSRALDFPLLLKLHGSSNWKIDKTQKKILPNMSKWSELNKPGYRGDVGEGTWFPIFLPFWEKRIEQEPWIQLWKLAYRRLLLAESVIVWGYSLPQTDVKAELLFKLGLEGRPILLRVIDPDRRSRNRWKRLFPAAQFCESRSIQEYFSRTP